MGDKWMQQIVTKKQLPLISAVADSERQAWLAHQSRQKHKEPVTFPAKKKEEKKKARLSSSLHQVTLAHTQRWPFSLNWVTLTGGGELWK